MDVNSFRRELHRGCLKGFSICLGLGICITPGFCLCQGSEYTRVLNMPVLHYGDTPWLHRVGNMPG